MSQDNFEQLVSDHYESLYRFAFSLTQAEADAWDLTQQTFYLWSTKGHQLRDFSKVKGWLFTTLHRVFLAARKRQTRFPHFELTETQPDLPVITPQVANQLDSDEVVRALNELDEIYRGPIALFYLEDYSYQQIADILGTPIGTVKSRIARGLMHLRRILLTTARRASGVDASVSNGSLPMI
jgi:RNA polymerase sigma-70 factor (ECF subfamily)